MTSTDISTSFTFTKSALNAAMAALADQKNVELRDEHTRGLILRKQAKGWRFGVFRKIHGKLHRVTLEEYGPTSDLNRIRAQAVDIQQEIRNGKYTPQKAKAAIAQVATNATAMSIGEALALHIRVNPQLREATRTAYAHAVLWLMNIPAERGPNGRVDVLGTASKVSQPIAALSTDQVRTAYDRLCNAGKVASGNSMLRSLRAIFNTWADETESDTRNPVLRITAKRGRVHKVAPRTGAIPPDQQAAWFESMEQQARNSATFSTARACQLLFLTGLRLNEVLGLRWVDVDLTLTIPAERMKSGVELVRPITHGMQHILDAQRKMIHPDTEWVFPASRGNGHVTDTRKTLAKAEPQIINHDLRRGYIVAGLLAGVPDIAVKMLVGHTIADVTENYAKAIESELPKLAQRIEDQLLRDIAPALRVVA